MSRPSRTKPRATSHDVATRAGVSQPTVSHHLKILVDAGILIREQRGKWAYYSLSGEAVERLPVGALGLGVLAAEEPEAFARLEHAIVLHRAKLLAEPWGGVFDPEVLIDPTVFGNVSGGWFEVDERSLGSRRASCARCTDPGC